MSIGELADLGFVRVRPCGGSTCLVHDGTGETVLVVGHKELNFDADGWAFLSDAHLGEQDPKTRGRESVSI